jgi:hypothetical protein
MPRVFQDKIIIYKNVNDSIKKVRLKYIFECEIICQFENSLNIFIQDDEILIMFK